MTGVLVALFVAIGIGCAYLRLSALAVALIVLVLAVVGIFVGLPGGWSNAALMALAPMLLIECTYFIGMLIIARFVESAPTEAERSAQKAPSRITEIHQ